MRILRSVFLVAAAIAAPSTVYAQASITVGAGATIPNGDYADYAKLGWLAHGGVEFPVATNVSVGAHGFFGSNSHDEDVVGVAAGDKTNLYGGVGTVGYAIPTSGSLMPQVWGGAGYLVHSFKSDTYPEGSDGSLAAIAGVGLGFPLGSVNGVFNAYFLAGFGENDDTRYIGLDVGVNFPLGG